jgi:DNA-binding Lrp family transcriptional regulator
MNKGELMDKTYIIMDIIDKNANITQREISKRVNLSLGSVNILLNKMAREGLIKIKQIPMNRVVYMLTPKGIGEKVEKTCSYIKSHYTYIYETKEKMKNGLERLRVEYGKTALLLDTEDKVMCELAKAAAEEVCEIEMISDMNALPDVNVIVTTSSCSVQALQDKGIRAVNILELI